MSEYGPYSSRLEKVIECLALEGESQDESLEVKQTLCLAALGYLDEKLLSKELNILAKKGFSNRLIRAYSNLIEDETVLAVTETLLAAKLFNQSNDTIKSAIVGIYEFTPEEEGEFEKNYQYLLNAVDTSSLSAADNVYGIDDLSTQLLQTYVPGAARIETTSKFGMAVEKLLASYNSPMHNDLIRQAFVKYAAGLITKLQWAEALKSHRRQFSSALFERVLTRTTEELGDMFGKIVKYGYTNIEEVCDYVGKVTPEDYNYIMLVIGDQPVGAEMLVYGSEITEIEDYSDSTVEAAVQEVAAEISETEETLEVSEPNLEAVPETQTT